jgi:uncharacterized protein involved in cysteine biosynthesis
MEWKPVDIVLTILILPLLMGIALVMGLYWMVYFPIWWIKRAVKTKKRWLKWRDTPII